MIYVSNFNSHSITAFASSARGDATPMRMITGARTGLSNPVGLAVDAQRNLYVANRTGGGVTVYPSTANGNVPPLRTLAAAGLRAAQALAIGSAGDVFVSSCPNDDSAVVSSAAIFHFAADATQSDHAIAGSKTGLSYPVGLAIDEDRTLYVANGFGGVVSAFACGATGNALPRRSFTAATANTRGIAYALNTLLLLDAGIYLYPRTAASGAKPAAVFGRSALLPLRYPGGVAVDTSVTSPIVCVADFAAHAVYVIRTTGAAPHLSVAAVTTIKGAGTGLNGPVGVLVVHEERARTSGRCFPF